MGNEKYSQAIREFERVLTYYSNQQQSPCGTIENWVTLT